MERRKPSRSGEVPTPLPQDYLRLVTEVFQQTFAVELGRLADTGQAPAFEASGRLFPTEAVLAVSLLQEGVLGATTVHASCDFELTEDEAPSDAEARLAACVDVIGGVFTELLAPEALPRLRQGTLATLAQVPPGWSETHLRDYAIHVLVDSSNPRLEALTEEWLRANAPAESSSAEPAAEEPTAEDAAAEHHDGEIEPAPTATVRGSRPPDAKAN